MKTGETQTAHPAITRGPRLSDTSPVAVYRAELAASPILRDVQVGMMVLSGSHAYGLATAESDIDYRGFYITPTDQLLSLDPPPAQRRSNEPDLVCWEAGKYIHALLQANPNMLETLWAPVICQTPAGQLIRANRDAFLSQQARRTYAGYANGKLADVIRLEEGSPKRAKAVRHLFRVLHQGIELLETGSLSVRVKDAAALRALEALTDEQVTWQVADLTDRLRDGASVLPETPDRTRANEILLAIRHGREAGMLAA